MEASGTAAQVADRWTFVWSAPAFALGLMVIVAATPWWLRSTLGRSEINGLKAQISAAQAIGKMLEQRLRIVSEQAAVATLQQSRPKSPNCNAKSSSHPTEQRHVWTFWPIPLRE
jgi:hypothetical protein